MGSSSKKDIRGTGIMMAVLVAAGRAATVDLSVLNSVSNKSKDRSWKIGDQAMKKTGNTPAMTRGCLHE
jgi:hypothetical protein